MTGRILAVWGPAGAGVSTVAAAFAGAWADTRRVVLVDADLYRGALRVLLRADVGGNIASASRFPAPAGAPCPHDHLERHRSGFALLPGVPGPAQGVAVDPVELVALLERLAAAFDLVVVDVGSTLAPDDAAGRGHRAALGRADGVVVVAAATRLGMSDLFLQIGPLGVLAGFDPTAGAPWPRPIWAILNRGQGGKRLEVYTRRVERELGLPVAAYVPTDDEALWAAEEKGLPVTGARPGNPASRALCDGTARVWRAMGPEAVGVGRG